jgi:hypothetical protein
VLLGRVGTNDQDEIRISDFFNGIGHCAAAKGDSQTGYRWAVSETGAVIDTAGS